MNPVMTQPVSSVIEHGMTPVQTALSIASLVWVAGLSAMLIYAVASYLSIALKVRESSPFEGNILRCDRIDTPFILGILRPRIYLPTSLRFEDQKYVIVHEQAHLKRCDHLWKPLGFVLLAVYWFNPILWVAYIFLCRDIELACDERVIRSLGKESKKPYSTALINCSVPRRLVSACPLAFGEVGVKGRVNSILNYKKPTFWIVTVSIVLCTAVSVCFLTDPHRPEPEQPHESNPQEQIGTAELPDDSGMSEHTTEATEETAEAQTDAADGQTDESQPESSSEAMTAQTVGSPDRGFEYVPIEPSGIAPTQESTPTPTEAPTQPPTEAPTEPTTEAPTQPPTQREPIRLVGYDFYERDTPMEGGYAVPYQIKFQKTVLTSMETGHLKRDVCVVQTPEEYQSLVAGFENDDIPVDSSLDYDFFLANNLIVIVKCLPDTGVSYQFDGLSADGLDLCVSGTRTDAGEGSDIVSYSVTVLQVSKSDMDLLWSVSEYTKRENPGFWWGQEVGD